MGGGNIEKCIEKLTRLCGDNNNNLSSGNILDKAHTLTDVAEIEGSFPENGWTRREKGIETSSVKVC